MIDNIIQNRYPFVKYKGLRKIIYLLYKILQKINTFLIKAEKIYLNMNTILIMV